MATGSPQTLLLHPSGMADNPGGYWTVPVADEWETYLDLDDGDVGAKGIELFILRKIGVAF